MRLLWDALKSDVSDLLEAYLLVISGRYIHLFFAVYWFVAGGTLNTVFGFFWLGMFALALYSFSRREQVACEA